MSRLSTDSRRVGCVYLNFPQRTAKAVGALVPASKLAHPPVIKLLQRSWEEDLPALRLTNDRDLPDWLPRQPIPRVLYLLRAEVSGQHLSLSGRGLDLPDFSRSYGLEVGRKTSLPCPRQPEAVDPPVSSVRRGSFQWLTWREVFTQWLALPPMEQVLGGGSFVPFCLIWRKGVVPRANPSHYYK